MKPISFLVTVFLALVSIGHLLRLIFQVEIMVGNVHIPMWMSGVTFLVTGLLAVFLYRE